MKNTKFIDTPTNSGVFIVDFEYQLVKMEIGSQNMVVGNVLGFENCSTKSNLKNVQTEIDFKVRIEFWKKSNHDNFLPHFLLYIPFCKLSEK